MKKPRKKYHDTPERKAYRQGLVHKNTMALAIHGGACLSKSEQMQRLSILQPAVQAFISGQATVEQAREIQAIYNVLVCMAAIPGIFKGDMRTLLQELSASISNTILRYKETHKILPTPEDVDLITQMFDLFADALANVPERHIRAAETTYMQRAQQNNGVCPLTFSC